MRVWNKKEKCFFYVVTVAAAIYLALKRNEKSKVASSLIKYFTWSWWFMLLKH